MPIIRMIAAEDASEFLTLARQLDEETAYMMLESGERTTTLAEQQMRIQEVLATVNSAVFVAEDDGRLVGYLEVTGGQAQRSRRTGCIVIGILQSYAGQGLGTRLFEQVNAWARAVGLHRLELTVMTHNAAGVALYRKMGFTIEGTKRHSLVVDGAWVDEYYMAKLLD